MDEKKVVVVECDPSTLEGQEQAAALNYELWQMLTQMSPTSKVDDISNTATHRQAALELYQKLYEKTPKFGYKKRIKELESITNQE